MNRLKDNHVIMLIAVQKLKYTIITFLEKILKNYRSNQKMHVNNTLYK